MLEIAELLNDLNPEQRKAVLHKDGPAIVLAGAGSGKTTVLTTRVAYLIKEKKLPASSIFLVTFTNKAAAEMQKRVFESTGQRLAFSGTFHSLAAKILRIEAGYGNLEKFGLNANFTIYDSDNQLSVIKNIYKNNGFDSATFKPQVVKAKISSAKNELISPIDFKETASDSLQIFTAKVYKIYEKRLRDENAVDFDDLLSICYRLLMENEAVRKKYQEKFLHVLVDEFQDTNKVQYFLSKILAKNPRLPSSEDNLFAVGDFSQSIYAWRGADYRNLKRLSQDFKNITEYRLERNYRSTQNILDAATSVISNNLSHPVLELWTDQTSEEKLEVYETSSGELEAEKIASIIKEKYSDKLNEIVLLYRTNVQSRTFEEAFMRRKLAYKIVGGTKFYDRSEIKDLLAYLRLCFNKLDSPSRIRAEKNGKRRLAKLDEWLSKTNQATIENPSTCLQGILENTLYLDKYDQKDAEDADRLANIQELFNVASRFDNTLLLLENIALVQDGYLANEKDFEQKENNEITMMSLHSAKGLEFPIVFMVGMEEGLLPHSRAIFESNEIEEERRLCYVGITRAKEKLYFSYARSRFTYGYSSDCMPSRFLAEIDQKLLKMNRSFDSASSHPEREKYFYKKTKTEPTNKKPKQRLVIDDESLEALLNDELDIREFLKK
ncbi:MAG: ATP-dependent DNA helicase PcrA [Candidatus Pacebacteria bacterium GW2011_GWF2_38_9]|nr:MAG: UvrD/REP helicase [candidate division TM6 bacterium GW2011_GWF2_28_16]KKQ10091.1 MAG: ATP-dependent DNA helicase PcrA [Candidatus Pacebacteria bacterium GW2011_GWF1_36_5]KKQ89047.1 MAG: ATP-dependent DNA helicase PcrA [Candidatus Pacebacteria bacterium GW2011_GWF2_38_9]HAZ73549.1 ATP-dependent DNA helicase PcrA [Candidatus Paceibacterota bacterium]